MDCASCGRENRDDARFCAGCGTPITATCVACNRELAPDARFCDGCGTPVADAAGPAPVPAPDDAAADAVRKTVTALFCDLMGSTTFAETVDPESAREAMARYHAMASAVIEGRDGTVAKFIGDGVMALFGVPEVAEDDAERAVATGLDLQRGFEPIQRHIADRYGVELGLRVGVNTGEVVIAADDADVVGDALNTAARLEAACDPGEVLVGESTWRLTRATVRYDPLGSVEVRGKAAPVATYQVIAEQAEADELSTPFVGRDREMALLTSTFADAAGAGEARFLTVIGSPGVGKTRLAAELVRGLDEEARAFDLRCERAGTATFAPVADLLREAADIDDGLAADEIGARIGTLVGSAGDGERVAELLGGFVGASPARSTEEMFFAVRRLIEILGRDHPVVLVVDDIQWAEPLFLDLLEHLAEWVNAAPALIIGLARPEIREVRPLLAEPGRRVAEVISLEGLDSAATEQLAAELIGGRALPAELAARLPTSTEGNPLFVRELMRMLVDDGVIVDAGDSWALAIDAEAIEVPPTINSLLATRVERLSDADRRVLELAAVVGPEFPRGAVGAVASSLSGSEIDAALERLRRRELVEPTGSYWGDEPVFRFHHVLIRDAAYRRLLKGARAELHVAVGEWTEATAGGLVGEHDVAIGFHFEQAHDYRRELDLRDDETVALGRRAAASFRTAAERALERDDLAAAGALAARGVACLEDDDRSLAALLLIGCEALLGTGAVAAGRPLVDRLSTVADGDDRLTAWAECYGAELRVLADPEGLVDAERAANEAAARLAELDEQSGVAKARLVRAQALARLGRVGDCEAELDEALGAARSAGDDRRVTAVLGAAPVAALWGPSPVPRAGGRCLDVIRLLRITTGSPAVEAVSVRCQAVLEALRGRHDTARAMLDQARGTLEELGLRQGLLQAELYAGLVELLAGDAVEAEPHLRAAHGGLGQLGIGADVGQAAAYLARALMEQGRLDEARELAEESETLAGQNPQTLIAARAVRAEILAATGALDDALALADDAVALASGSDLLVDHANAVAAQARVRASAGDVTGAATAAAAAAGLYEQKGAVVEVRVAAETVAEVAAAPAGRPSIEPRNRADRHTRRQLQLQMVGERDAYAAGISEHGEIDDRRRLTPSRTVGREAALAAWIDVIDTVDDPGRVEMIETLEVRGDDLVLHRVRVRIGPRWTPGEPDALLVSRVDAQGLGDLFVLFDADDLDAAIVELDRLAAREGTTDHTIAVGTTMRLQEYLRAGDLDGASSLMSPGIEVDDRRAGVRSDYDGGEVAAFFGWMAETGLVGADGSDFEAPRVLATRGVRHLAAADSYVTPDGFRFDFFVAVRVDVDGRQVKSILVDTEAEAMAALDDLVAEEDRSPDLVNTMTRFFGRMDGFADATVLAVRGDLLALVERLTDTDSELVVGVASATGEVDAKEVFTADDLAAAVDRLNELWLDGEAAGVAGMDVIFEWGAAIRANDPVRLDRVLADDLTGESNARLSVKDFTKRGFMEDFVATADVPGTVVTKKVHAIGDHHCVVTAANYVRDAAGEWREVSMVNHNVERDGRLVRFDQWSTDDLDVALARFDAWEAAAGHGTLAARMLEVSVAALNARDADALLATLSDDFELEDRRPGFFGGDAETSVAIADATDENAVWTEDLVETRGARLAALRVVRTEAGIVSTTFRACRMDIDGKTERAITVETEAEALAVLEELEAEEQRSPELVNTMTMLFERMDGYADAEVLAVRGDLVALVHRPTDGGGELVVGAASVMAEPESLTVFESDQLPEALDHLHAIWLDREETPAGRDVLSAWDAATRRPDGPEAMRRLDELMADDFVGVSHVALHLRSFSKSGLLQYFGSTLDLPDITITTKIHAWRDRQTLSSGGMFVGFGRDASVTTWVTLTTERDGQIVRIDQWDGDDLDAALARFDELAPSAVGESLAERTTRVMTDAMNRGDLDTVREGLTDDFRSEDRRPGLPGHDVESSIASVADGEGRARWEGEVIHTRGVRHLVLHVTRHEAGMVSENWRANRIDLDGKTSRSITVESEASAVAALDELVAEEDRSPELVNTVTMLFERMDGFAEAEVLAIRDDVYALVRRPGADGSEPELVLGMASPAGEIDSIETFSDSAAALDRLDELAGTTLARLRPHHLHGLDGPDLETALHELASAYTDDYRLRSHRRLGSPELDVERELEFWRASAELGLLSVTQKLHAIAPGLAVFRATTATEDGATIPIVALQKRTEDGRFSAMDTWDLDDLPAALARFDEIVAMTATPTLGERVMERSDEALARDDLEALAASMVPHFRCDDRRSVVALEYDRDLVVANAPSLRGQRAETIGTRGARIVARRHRFDRDGFVNEFVGVFRATLDETVELAVLVETEAEALAVLDELEAQEQRSPELFNTMTMLFDRMDGFADAKVLSIRGDLIAMVEQTTEAGQPELAVGLASPAAEVVSVDRFPVDQLEAAAVRTLELTAEQGLLGPGSDVWLAYGAAISAGDVEAVGRAVHDDLVLRNAQSLFPDIDDKAGMLAYLEENVATLGITYPRKILADAPDRILMWIVHDVRSADGSAVLSELLVLNQARDGKIALLEEWPLDELPIALARFDELASTTG